MESKSNTISAAEPWFGYQRANRAVATESAGRARTGVTEGATRGAAEGQAGDDEWISDAPIDNDSGGIGSGPRRSGAGRSSVARLNAPRLKIEPKPSPTSPSLAELSQMDIESELMSDRKKSGGAPARAAGPSAEVPSVSGQTAGTVATPVIQITARTSVGPDNIPLLKADLSQQPADAPPIFVPRASPVVENASSRGVLIAFIDIVIGDGRIGQVGVRDGDDVYDLTARFLRRHKLDRRKYLAILATSIKNRIGEYLEKLEERLPSADPSS